MIPLWVRIFPATIAVLSFCGLLVFGGRGGYFFVVALGASVAATLAATIIEALHTDPPMPEIPAYDAAVLERLDDVFDKVAAVLAAHQPADSGGCSCGWLANVTSSGEDPSGIFVRGNISHEQHRETQILAVASCLPEPVA